MQKIKNTFPHFSGFFLFIYIFNPAQDSKPVLWFGPDCETASSACCRTGEGRQSPARPGANLLNPDSLRRPPVPVPCHGRFSSLAGVTRTDEEVEPDSGSRPKQYGPTNQFPCALFFSSPVLQSIDTSYLPNMDSIRIENVLSRAKVGRAPDLAPPRASPLITFTHRHTLHPMVYDAVILLTVVLLLLPKRSIHTYHVNHSLYLYLLVRLDSEIPQFSDLAYS
jgi:hypothetical protein